MSSAGGHDQGKSFPVVPVSVIIPARNAEAYLGEALASVFAQTCPAMEVFVVDDGSTDSTARIAESFPGVQCLRQSASGIAAARNAGVRAARGNCLAFLDADDLWAPNKLELQWRAFEQDRTLDMVFGHAEQFISPDLSAELRANLICNPAPIPGRFSGTMMVRAQSFQRVGEFDIRWRSGEFIDWYIRARQCGLKDRLLPEVLCRRRLHGGNHGRLRRWARQDYARILKKALDRRRGGHRRT